MWLFYKKFEIFIIRNECVKRDEEGWKLVSFSIRFLDNFCIFIYFEFFKFKVSSNKGLEKLNVKIGNR